MVKGIPLAENHFNTFIGRLDFKKRSPLGKSHKKMLQVHSQLRTIKKRVLFESSMNEV